MLIKTIVSNDKGVLRAGQFVRARLVWATHRGPMVPFGAALRLNGQYFAFVVEDSGHGLVARQRAVALGDLSGDSYVVRAGLNPGDRVVVSGVQKIRDGSPVVPE